MTCCSCDCSEGTVGTAVTIRILPLLLVIGLAFAVFRMISGDNVGPAAPDPSMIPAFALATTFTVVGMWLGYRLHRRGEPIAVAAFGFLVIAAGYVIYPPIILVGVLIVIGGTLWSAVAVKDKGNSC